MGVDNGWAVHIHRSLSSHLVYGTCRILLPVVSQKASYICGWLRVYIYDLDSISTHFVYMLLLLCIYPYSFSYYYFLLSFCRTCELSEFLARKTKGSFPLSSQWQFSADVVGSWFISIVFADPNESLVTRAYGSNLPQNLATIIKQQNKKNKTNFFCLSLTGGSLTLGESKL